MVKMLRNLEVMVGYTTVNMLNATKLYTFIYYYFYLEYKVVGFIML